MFKYAHVCDMRFIGRVLHNFTFHDNFSHFSDVHGLPRDVEEIRQITCPDVAHGIEQFLKIATVFIRGEIKILKLLQRHTNYVSDFRKLLAELENL